MSKLGLILAGISTYVLLCYACTWKNSQALSALAHSKSSPSAAPSATPTPQAASVGVSGKLNVWYREGTINLSGKVTSKALKDRLLGEAVNRYGARGVVGNLTVASPEEAIDAEWETIALKSVVWGKLGDIAIDGKILTLRGMQPNEQAKNSRYEYVKSVIPATWGLVDGMEVSRADSKASSSEAARSTASSTPAASPTPGSVSSARTNDTTPANLQAFKAVEFRPGSAELTDDGRALLSRAAEVMATTGVTRYEIGGHTDDLGTDDANLNISERRADAVRKHLMDQGIAPERLEEHGYGEARPIVPNSSDADRTRNRRIEFTELK